MHYLSKISIFISSFNINVTKKSVKNTNAKFITALYCKPHYLQYHRALSVTRLYCLVLCVSVRLRLGTNATIESRYISLSQHLLDSRRA